MTYLKAFDKENMVDYECEVCCNTFQAPPGLHRGERLCGDGVCLRAREEEDAREEFDNGPMGVGA